MSEMQFRRMAGLCRRCGMARADVDLCRDCQEKDELAEMRYQWRKWGIAA